MRTDERRIIAGPRNRNFDHYITDLIHQRGYGYERTWHGIPDEERADHVRRRLRQAGHHVGVRVKAFWKPGDPCRFGCQFHVYYTAYEASAARRYKLNQLAVTARQRA